MPDIFGNATVPAWLQKITMPVEPGETGALFGQLIGSLGNAYENAKEKQAQGINTSWIKEIPQGIHDANLNIADPMWKLKVQQAQLGLAQQKLSMDAQQENINLRKTQIAAQAHDNEVLPKWLRDHPTWQSRVDAEPPDLWYPAAQNYYRKIRQSDFEAAKQTANTESKGTFGAMLKELTKLDPTSVGEFSQVVGTPTKEQFDSLGAKLAAAQAKHAAEIQPIVKEFEGQKFVVEPKSGVAKPLPAPKDAQAQIQAEKQMRVNDYQSLNKEAAELRKEYQTIPDRDKRNPKSEGFRKAEDIVNRLRTIERKKAQLRSSTSAPAPSGSVSPPPSQSVQGAGAQSFDSGRFKVTPF